MLACSCGLSRVRSVAQSLILIVATIAVTFLVFSPFIIEFFRSTFEGSASSKRRWAKLSALTNASVAIILSFTLIASILNLYAIRDEFLSNHPPRFLIKEINISLTPDEVPKGSLIVVNGGDSDASFVPTTRAERGTVLVHISNKPLPAKSLMSKYQDSKDWPNMLKLDTIRSGAAVKWEFKGEQELSDHDIRDIEEGNRALYVIGLLKYLDERGVGRRTLFCRIYDPKSKTFEHTNNSDCEYGT